MACERREYVAGKIWEYVAGESREYLNDVGCLPDGSLAVVFEAEVVMESLVPASQIVGLASMEVGCCHLCRTLSLMKVSSL